MNDGRYRLVLLRHGLLPATVHTSLQRRTIRTGSIALAAADTLRALVKYLDAISDAHIVRLDIPNGVPLAYELGPDLRPLIRGGRYLIPRT
jgi:hypothetical protein